MAIDYQDKDKSSCRSSGCRYWHLPQQVCLAPRGFLCPLDVAKVNGLMEEADAEFADTDIDYKIQQDVERAIEHDDAKEE